MARVCRVGVLLWLGLGLLCALAPALAARRQAAVPAEQAIARDLRSRTAFVAVLIDRRDSSLLRSEAYADWYSYYTAFVEREKGRHPVYTLAPQRAGALFRRLGRKFGNATFFVDRKGAFLVHDGLVLEPRVYEIGAGFMEQGSVEPEAARYGLIRLEVKQSSCVAAGHGAGCMKTGR
jgi:hypothetical protein